MPSTACCGDSGGEERGGGKGGGPAAYGFVEVQLAEAKQKHDQSAEALGVLTSEQSTLEGKLQKEKERNTKAKEVVMKQQAERKSLVQQKEELEAKVKSGARSSSS